VYTTGYTGSYVSGDTVVQGTGHHYSSSVYYNKGYPNYYWPPYTYTTWGYSTYYYGGPYYHYPYYHYPYYDYDDLDDFYDDRRDDLGHTTKHEGKYGSGSTYHYGPYSETNYSGKKGDTKFETKQYRTPYNSGAKQPCSVETTGQRPSVIPMIKEPFEA
jgi:hypothetical protein